MEEDEECSSSIPLNPDAPEFWPTHIPWKHGGQLETSTTPTQNLLIYPVRSDLPESIVRRDLQVFGEIKSVQMERVEDEYVEVHFYDKEVATKALNKIQQQHRIHLNKLAVDRNPMKTYQDNVNTPSPAGLVNGACVWAVFIVPRVVNQGTVAVFKLSSDVTARMLKEKFEEAYGRVKDVRVSSRPNTKYVEFYDTRDASKAFNDIPGHKINGKKVAVQFPKPKNRKQKETPGGCSSSKQGKGARNNTEDRVESVNTSSDLMNTVYIQNIPNRYSKEELMAKLDAHCKKYKDDQPPSAYDFLHLPMDNPYTSNKGYTFVNMTSLAATKRLYGEFNNQEWAGSNSEKICKLSNAKCQGLDALKTYYLKRDSRYTSSEYKPMVFVPPRDGNVLTLGTPITDWNR